MLSGFFPVFLEFCLFGFRVLLVFSESGLRLKLAVVFEASAGTVEAAGREGGEAILAGSEDFFKDFGRLLSMGTVGDGEFHDFELERGWEAWCSVVGASHSIVGVHFRFIV